LLEYQNRAKLKENTALSISLRSARSKQEKAAIYSRYLHAKITEKDLQDAEDWDELLRKKKGGEFNEEERRRLIGYVQKYRKE